MLFIQSFYLLFLSPEADFYFSFVLKNMLKSLNSVCVIPFVTVLLEGI